MKVRHHVIIQSTCPVDRSEDRYDCYVYSRRLLKCEDVIAAVGQLTTAPVFQELLTQRLADVLGCKVKTSGLHVRGTVRTTVVCRPGKLSRRAS